MKKSKIDVPIIVEYEEKLREIVDLSDQIGIFWGNLDDRNKLEERLKMLSKDFTLQNSKKTECFRKRYNLFCY